MTSVYKFCPSNSNTSTTSNTSTNSTNSTNITNLEINDETFPKLGSVRSLNPIKGNSVVPTNISLDSSKKLEIPLDLPPVVSKQESCWGNKAVMETIKIPFPIQKVVPTLNIPPLFNIIKKKKNQIYEEEYETDSDDEYENYDSENETNSDSDDDFN